MTTDDGIPAHWDSDNQPPMTDEEYLIAAARLTGWVHTDECGEYCELPDSPTSLYLDDMAIHSAQWFKDALAAQLVRQVDATDDYLVKTFPHYSVVRRSRYENHYVVAEVRGDDRAMNTIKAIVDAGVLSTAQGERAK